MVIAKFNIQILRKTQLIKKNVRIGAKIEYSLIKKSTTPVQRSSQDDRKASSKLWPNINAFKMLLFSADGTLGVLIST